MPRAMATMRAVTTTAGARAGGRRATATARARRTTASRALTRDLAQVALELDGETLTAAAAAVLGLGAGLGIPIFFVQQEKRDKERLEEIRELKSGDAQGDWGADDAGGDPGTASVAVFGPTRV